LTLASIVAFTAVHIVCIRSNKVSDQYRWETTPQATKHDDFPDDQLSYTNRWALGLCQGELLLIKADFTWATELEPPQGESVGWPGHPCWETGLHLGEVVVQLLGWPSPRTHPGWDESEFLGYRLATYDSSLNSWIRYYGGNPKLVPSSGGFRVAIPLVTFGIIALILFAIALRKWIRYDRWEKHGHCMQCGYDLRASEIRCPECGSEIPCPLQTNDSVAD
jgi:hypothetical protein